MSTCPIPCLESSLTPSHMPKPNVRKIQFSKQKVFVLENLLPNFSKYIGQPSEVNCWVILRNSHGSTSEMNCWTTLQGNYSENFPFPFTTVFIFLPFSFMSCTHTYHLGCPSAYGMHYAISTQFMLIYFTCIYEQNLIHIIHVIQFTINNTKISSHGLITI